MKAAMLESQAQSVATEEFLSSEAMAKALNN